VGAGGVRPERPGRDPPVRADVVHESTRTRVTRLFLDGRTLIRKEPLGPDAQQQLRHELAILERLRGIAGVAQLVEAPRYPDSITLEDVGGSSLAALSTPLGPTMVPVPPKAGPRYSTMPSGEALRPMT